MLPQLPRDVSQSHAALRAVSYRVRASPPDRPLYAHALHRLEAFFHTYDELLHMWAHADDLDTLEFALMQIVSYIVGPVRSAAFVARVWSSPVSLPVGYRHGHSR